VVREALKTIPSNTKYHQCISDVIKWHAQYPKDWKATWYEIQKKWSDDIGCPDGVFNAYDIDATLNSAYVVMGLLYGQGDFSKTLEISTRAGQDADCNPSTAGGILGVMLGYDKIPAYWKMGLKEIEDLKFKFTSSSLNRVYQLSYQQALDNIQRNGGKVGDDMVTIPAQAPQPVRYEQSFTGLHPFDKIWIGKDLASTSTAASTTAPATVSDTEYEFGFTGNGFVIKGESRIKTEMEMIQTQIRFWNSK